MTVTPALPLDDRTVGAFVDAAAPILGLAIDPAWRDGVIGNLKAVASAAGLVLAFPLEDELEPAPVFGA